MRASSRGQVPVLRRPIGNPSSASCSLRAHRGEVAGAAGGIILEPDMDQALQESSGREDDRRRLEDLADLRLDAADCAVFDDQPLDARLADLQIRGVVSSTRFMRAR